MKMEMENYAFHSTLQYDFFLKFSFITVVLSEECSLVKKMSNFKKIYI